MESKTAHGLKVISKTNSAESSRHQVRSTLGAQQALFPLRSSRSLIFVSLPDVDHRIFVTERSSCTCGRNEENPEV